MADFETDFAAALKTRAREEAAAEGAPFREEPQPQSDDAPYGYTIDPETGEPRPKKRAGRPRKSPSLDDLKADKAGVEGMPPPEDLPPDDKRKKTGGKSPERPLPPFREGQIAKGMNKLYRRAGKLLRAVDPLTGQAMIDVTRKEDEDDVTVGEAWEEVARHNPRVRRFLLKMIAGGAWGQLFWAHAPILLAIFMHDSVRRFIPGSKLVEAFLSDDEDGEAIAAGTPFDGLQPADMNEMMAAAQQMAAQMFSGRGFSMPRPPDPDPEANGAGPIYKE